MPETSRRPIRILHVDDRPDFLDVARTFLEREDDRFSVETATSADQGWEMIDSRPPDCVVSDYNMPGTDGIEFLQTVREEYPDLPFVLFTDEGGEGVASDAISAGVTDYLRKQRGTEQYELLANRIRNIVTARRDAAEATRQRDLMERAEILGATGGWELRVESGDIRLTDGIKRIYGVETDRDLSLEDVIGFYEPDAQREIRSAIDDAIEDGYGELDTLHLETANGEKRVVEGTAERVETGDEGTVLRGVIHDITDSTERRRELEQERDLVREILETVPVGISVHDTDGSISFMNEQMESVGGRPLADIEGSPHDESRYGLVDRHGEPLGPGETPFDRVVSRGATVHNQVVGVRRPSGERVWLSVSGSPQYNDRGELERTVFALEDITERRELEAELSEILGRISDGFFALDEAFRFTHVNARAEELLEASEDELLGETLWEMYPEAAERDRIWDGFHVAMDTQTPRNLELYYDPLGIWVDATVHPSESGVSVYFRDVTERKEREQEIRELKRQYEALAENFPDGAVFLVDADMTYVRARGEELSRVGLSPGDIEGTEPHALFPEGIADELRHHYEEAFDGAATTFHQTYAGERYRVQTVPVRTDDDESINHVMAVSQNVTERTEDKRELERQNERLEELAGIVSHDLRNPLRVADGRVALLRDERESDHLDDVARALDRMDALIEDVLTLARGGERVEATDTVELASVAESGWQTVNTDRAALETDADLRIEADRSRLRQLFENLYRNAVEHGGDGVTVSVGAIDGGFYVADTGSGIPKADREEIFEMGYSTDEAGTGLGLGIVEQVADAHGWDLAVTESTQGGARFEITGVECADR
jgi:PAS domain S-box-containing protein